MRKSEEMSNTIPLSLDNRIFYHTKNVFTDFHLYLAMIGVEAHKKCMFDSRKIHRLQIEMMDKER